MSKQRSQVKTETQSFLGSKAQKDAIYEIYRSCRLCGAAKGYKMPIIQNIIPIEDTEVELKTKIQECLQIEVMERCFIILSTLYIAELMFPCVFKLTKTYST